MLIFFFFALPSPQQPSLFYPALSRTHKLDPEEFFFFGDSERVTKRPEIRDNRGGDLKMAQSLVSSPNQNYR